MKPEDLDKAMERRDYTPAPPPPNPLRPVKELFSGIDQAAIAYAKKWGLVREDGTIRCLTQGCKGDGTAPTLRCAPCRKRLEQEKNR